jgi:hypothetical protein
MNVRFALVAVVVLILAGCATTSTGPLPAQPPVKVVITVAPSLANVIDVAKAIAQTELALRRYASAAAPATVTVHLDEVTSVSGAAMTGPAMQGGPVPASFVSPEGVVSLTGWPEGFIPTTYTMPGRTQVVGSDLKVRGTYTITDENGVTLDGGPVLAPTGKNQQALARLIAMRVARLARPATRKRS